ncbi:MAG: hypothetical protein QXS37_04895 [Candidatus Aenigmatarchaeota archaeon]
MKKLLSIDPAVNNFGYVVLEKTNGNYCIKDFDVVSPKKAIPKDLYLTKTGRRRKNLQNFLLETKSQIYYLKFAYDLILNLIDKYDIDVICIEKPDLRPFIPRRTQMVLSMLYASILLAVSTKNGDKIKVITLTKGNIDKALNIKNTSYRLRKKLSVERYKEFLGAFKEKKISEGKLDHLTDALMVAEAFIKENFNGGITLCQK